MAPQTQTAVTLDRKQGSLSLTTIPVPRPSREEVLVKVKAAGLNPVDWKIQKYGFFVEKYPAVLGTDVVGEVITLGEGVTNVAIGDKVVFQGTYSDDSSSGFQQYSIADAHTIAKVPQNITLEEAATFPVALTAAYVGLYNKDPYGLGFDPPLTDDARGKLEGTPLLVLGGSSSVGQYVIQLARASGFSPIITTASLRHTEYLKSLGATEVLDRSLPPDTLHTALVRSTAEKPLAYVFDAISSAETQRFALSAITSGGNVAVVLSPQVESPPDNKKFISVVGVKQLPHNVHLLRNLWAKFTELVEGGFLKPNRVETLPDGLNGVIDGLKRLEDNKVSGIKLVALPQETP